MSDPRDLSASGSTPPEFAPARVSVASVLRAPQVAVTFGASMLARLPTSVIGLLVLLRVAPEYGYAAAGAVDAIFAVAVGVFTPLNARLVDRFGQSRVIVPYSIAAGAAAVAIGVVPHDSSVFVFAALAALNGALEPPFPGAMRTLWDELLHTEEERHVAFALDAAGNEVIWTAGPLVLIGAVAGTAGPSAALVACGVLTCVGGLAFSATRAARTWRAGQHERPAGLLAVAKLPGVVTFIVASIAAGVHFGAVEVGIAGYARTHGSNGSVGVLIAVWAIGSLIGGLVLARLGAATDPLRRMILTLGSLAVAAVAYGLAPSMPVLAVLLVIGGAGIAPFFATLNGALTLVAPPGTTTEAFGVTMTGVMIGATIGSPLAGVMIDEVSASAAIACGALGPALGVLALSLRRGSVPVQHPTAA